MKFPLTQRKKNMIVIIITKVVSSKLKFIIFKLSKFRYVILNSKTLACPLSRTEAMYRNLSKKEKQSKLAQARKRAILWSSQEQTQKEPTGHRTSSAIVDYDNTYILSCCL